MTARLDIRAIIHGCKSTCNFVGRRQYSSILQRGLIEQMAGPKSPLFTSFPKHFYRRPLPDLCISFNSDEGKKIFKEALLSGHMESYFGLAAQFRTQDEPAFCGLSTLVMVLNTLEVDPWRVWKGPWRWYHEQMLDCCLPLEEVEKKGINLEQFACLATCNTLKVHMVRVDESASLDEFREIIRSRSRQTREVVVTSYSRQTVGQTGDGHFSPIGGYHPERDLALILDVARFKYPPHWVSVPLLFEAMQKLDPETNRPRGYFVLQKSSHVPLVMFRLTEGLSIPASPEASATIHMFIHHWNDWLNRDYNGESESELISRALAVFLEALKYLPSNHIILNTQLDSLTGISHEHFITVKNLLANLESLPLYNDVSRVLKALSPEQRKMLDKVGVNQALPIPQQLLANCVSSTCGLPGGGQHLDVVQNGSPAGPRSCFSVRIEHYVAMLLLSWPYSRNTGSIGQAMLKLMHLQTDDSSPADVLSNETTQLRKQLTSISGYLLTCDKCVPECNCIVRQSTVSNAVTVS